MSDRVWLQKGTPTMEFCPYDKDRRRAIFPPDPKSLNLGDVDIRDGISKEELIRKLRDAADRLENYSGDVFVVQ